jgi:hypothetical protein
MARFYDPALNGGVNYIRCSVGGAAAVSSGAYTLISLVRLPLFQTASGLVAARRASAYARYSLITGAKLFGHQDFSSGFGAITSSAWTWIVQRKAAGAAHYEMAYALYPVVDPDADITFGEAPDAGNHTDPGAADEIWLGETDVHGRGDHALHAAYASRLGDAAIKTGLTAALTDLMALNPVGCWPLDQATALVQVQDVTGAGADEIATVGTVAVSADPPGYDFSIAPAPAQAIQIHAGRPGTRWRTQPPTGRWAHGRPDPKWKVGAPHA